MRSSQILNRLNGRTAQHSQMYLMTCRKELPTKELHGRWMNGPIFLQQPESEWPSQNRMLDMSEVSKERRKVTLAHAITVQKPIIKCENFSTGRRSLRVTAYVLRFIHNCKKVNRRQIETWSIVITRTCPGRRILDPKSTVKYTQ